MWCLRNAMHLLMTAGKNYGKTDSEGQLENLLDTVFVMSRISTEKCHHLCWSTLIFTHRSWVRKHTLEGTVYNIQIENSNDHTGIRTWHLQKVAAPCLWEKCISKLDQLDTPFLIILLWMPINACYFVSYAIPVDSVDSPTINNYVVQFTTQ